MRALLVSVGAALLVTAGLVTPAAHGTPATTGDGRTYGLVDGPWSASVTYQLFSPADTVSYSANESTNSLGLDDTDPSRVVLYGSGDFQETFTFAAPEASGRPLRAGLYGGAQPIGSADPTRPQMSFFGGSASDCDPSPVAGSFDVRELHRTDGEIDRLWILFEHDCAGFEGPIDTGQIRFGYPTGALAASPPLVSWPDQTFVGARSGAVDVAVHPTDEGSVQVDLVGIVGPEREHFEIVTDGCSNTDPMADACTVEVAFVPTTPGPHRARLRLSTSGRDLMVPLEARAIPRESVLDLDFEASHPLSGPYPPSASHLRLQSDDSVFYSGGFSNVGVHTFGDQFDTYDVIFDVPAGGVGTTYDFGEPGDVASFELLTSDGDCSDDHGSLNVHDQDLASDGTVRRAWVSFVHVCDDDPAESGRLTGDMKYRWAADVQAPASASDLQLGRTSTGRVVGSWEPPADTDMAQTVVRWYPGLVRAPRSPTAGFNAPVTTAGQVQLPPSTRGLRVTVAVFTFDETGNVSPPAVRRLRLTPRGQN